MKNYMKLELVATGENEAFARSAVAAFALRLNPTYDELSDVKTAVSEAMTNCVVHAYKKEEENPIVFIECHVEGAGENGETQGVLHITITDFGCGIDDVSRATTPFFTTLDNEERSGMGFTIMQTFMDSFQVESERGKGTRIRMSKRIKNQEEVMHAG